MGDVCIYCLKKPILIQSRSVCVNCYQKLKRQNLLTPVSKKIKEEQKIKRMRRKYGNEILRDFEKLNSSPFFNLADIGKKYGFSRERARQIYKQIYNKGYRKTQQKKTKKVKDDAKTVCVHDIRRKIADYQCTDNPVWKGVIGESRFFEECKSRNLHIKFFCKQAIDIMVNGYKVDVKSAFKSSKTTKLGYPYLRFQLSEVQSKALDFLACFHSGIDEFFIIPKKEFYKKSSIYILEKPAISTRSKNKHWKYLSAWQLLEKNYFQSQHKSTTLVPAPSTGGDSASGMCSRPA